MQVKSHAKSILIVIRWDYSVYIEYLRNDLQVTIKNRALTATVNITRGKKKSEIVERKRREKVMHELSSV